jgi:hypothetical protein
MQINYSQTSFDFSNPDDLNIATTTLAIHDGPKPFSREVIIDPICLDDRGDVSNSYSADVITNGRIRKPFRYDGQLYATTSQAYGTYRHAEAYRLVLPTLFDGQITDYHTKIDNDHGSAARSDPNGFYHGIRVTHQSRQYVLAGPPFTFLPNLPGT